MRSYFKIFLILQLTLFGNVLNKSDEFTLTIPGTILEIGKYYYLRMSDFPDGIISLSDNPTDPIDHCDLKVYTSKTQDLRDDVSKRWAFIAAPNESNWYHLVNLGRPGELVSWGKRKSSEGKTSWVLTLKHPTKSELEKDHYLFRPEMPTVPVQFNRYQLKIKSFPDAVIKWENIDESKYLKVEQLTNETKNDLEGYSKEFRKTCFTIDDNGNSPVHFFGSSSTSLVHFNYKYTTIVFTLVRYMTMNKL